MRVRLSREERLLGTAGGVKHLAKHFNETFVVVSGDALTDSRRSRPPRRP